VKCRQSENHTPRENELKICKATWLDRQISLVNPKLVVLLGKTSLKQVLGEKSSLSRLHGRIFRRYDQSFLVTFHPSAAMRFPHIKRQTKSDFAKLKALLKSA